MRSGLRELVPTAIRADDEENEFLREYKRKWLSRIDFKSDTYVDSLLFLAYLELALGRAQEAEWTADLLIRFVHFRNASPASRDDVIAALRLTAYLKARRGRDVSRLVAGTRSLSQRSVHHSREWLSHDARAEIDEALERQKLALLAYPMAGILAWLNEPAARPFAEPLLERALAAMRTFMK